jgi:hypothetical protein
LPLHEIDPTAEALVSSYGDEPVTASTELVRAAAPLLQRDDGPAISGTIVPTIAGPSHPTTNAAPFT